MCNFIAIPFYIPLPDKYSCCYSPSFSSISAQPFSLFPGHPFLSVPFFLSLYKRINHLSTWYLGLCSAEGYSQQWEGRKKERDSSLWLPFSLTKEQLTASCASIQIYVIEVYHKWKNAQGRNPKPERISKKNRWNWVDILKGFHAICFIGLTLCGTINQMILMAQRVHQMSYHIIGPCLTQKI